MKQNKTPFIPAGGVDTQITVPPSAASEVVNMRWDNKNGTWRSDFGFLPWWYPPSTMAMQSIPSNNWNIFDTFCDAVYFWDKPGSGQTYHFLQLEDGRLYVALGNKGNGNTWTASDTYVKDWYLIKTFEKRKPDEAGTQFIPFGKKILIINGKDEMLWFDGIDRQRQFSFCFPTPKLTALGIQADYQQGSPMEGYGTGAPYFTDNQVQGLGDTDGTRNYYEYAFAYATEDGAISPISDRDAVNWRVDQTPNAQEYKYGVSLSLPICPKGTKARYIYRTKNIKTADKTDAGTHQLYFVKEIKENASEFFIDFYGDGNLTQLADTFASTTIRTDWKYGENWNGRLWLADEDRIIYSEIGIPEQFSATNYFDLGNTFGGKITGIKGFSQNLIVFRENAINLITLRQDGGYGFSTLATHIGTYATNTICIVPEFGVVFANKDGIWAISGTTTGGSQISITKLSEEIDEEWALSNKSSQARWIAAYSAYEREYWVHYPTGFNIWPNQGVVLHTNKENTTFSFRKPLNAINEKLWWFASMTTDKNGRFIFGGIPSWSDGFNLDSRTQIFGHLQVWCPARQHGVTATVTGVTEGVPTFTVNSVQRTNGKWQSGWIDFPEGSVRVFSVEVELVAEGDTEMSLSYWTDYVDTENLVLSEKMTESKVVFTTSEPPVSVSSTEAYDTITKNPFTVVSLGQVSDTKVQQARKVRLRFDVNTGLCNQFKFEVQGSQNQPMNIIGYKLNLNTEATPRINQNTRLQKGQSR